MTMLPASWKALRKSVPCGLAGGLAHGRGFDAVVEGVAHQVHQRVADLLDDGLVEFGLAAVDHELHILAQILAGVAHQAVEAVEGLADLHRAQLQRGVADFLDQPGQQGRRFDQFAVAAGVGEQAGGRTGDHQLADQVDEVVELVGRHPDQLGVLGLLFADLGLLGHRGGDQLGLDDLLGDQDLADRPGLRPAHRGRRLGPQPSASSSAVSAPTRTRISPSRRVSSGRLRIRSR
jgi:hypothetical protein